MAQRRLVIDPHCPHRGTVTGTNSQAEATWSQLSYHLHLLHHYQGMAWKGRNNGGPKFNALGPPGGSRKDRNTIQASASSGHPHCRDISLLTTFNPPQDFMCSSPTYYYTNQLITHLQDPPCPCSL